MRPSKEEVDEAIALLDSVARVTNAADALGDRGVYKLECLADEVRALRAEMVMFQASMVSVCAEADENIYALVKAAQDVVDVGFPTHECEHRDTVDALAEALRAEMTMFQASMVSVCAEADENIFALVKAAREACDILDDEGLRHTARELREALEPFEKLK